MRCDAVDHNTAILVGFAYHRKQRPYAHIKTIGNNKANQQDADQNPPNDF